MRRALKVLSILALTTGVTLLVAELLAARTPEANVIAFVPDDDLLLVREPSKDGWSFMTGRWVRVRTNAYSMRDDDVPATKAPGELRVLCLGDSFTFGGGCEQDEAWPRQAQAVFGPPAASGVRVLNGGANGWETRFQRLFAEKYDAELLPDVIVLGWNWNDVALGTFSEKDARYFLTGGFGSLLGIDFSSTPLVRSKLYLYLHQRWHGTRHVPTVEETQARFENYGKAMGQRVLDHELEALRREDWPGQDAVVPEAWWIATDSPAFENVRRQLTLLAGFARERGLTFVVAMMPEPTWPGPGPYPPRARLAAMLDGLGVPWVDLMDDFLVVDADGNSRRDPSLWQELDYVHPNPEGQRRIGEHVARYLREEDLLRPRRAD